jgi:hypothetical protein
MNQAQFDKLIARFATALERALVRLPSDFCSGFEYTSRGKNLTHSIIVAELARIVAAEINVAHVGVDVRLSWQGPEKNLQQGKRCKFQPDVVGFDKDFKEIIYVDYESPNSSDERIIEKDIRPYLRWREITHSTAPYLLITTLPAIASRTWNVRYTSYPGYGAAAKGMTEKVRENPLQFWLSVWKDAPEMKKLQGAAILNINCQSVSQVSLT